MLQERGLLKLMFSRCINTYDVGYLPSIIYFEAMLKKQHVFNKLMIYILKFHFHKQASKIEHYNQIH